ncbi:MbcA/ParS/Xre antitoxin family protein [Tunicatimonas pelagia]|uniref:MbcA/ParS/Xre antitoxin family protein n=1 Tax=Tunicatimonas pelagia TaxID=931531 RepID=UPI0026652BC2|nr:MbcA/ParS/Xre antitoxin family protein [Tunicatimonas pelagia]WKN41515.1 MbcA/ParS/Xre antitoxin family protein [Tunicatimonas pelagia]
MSQTDEDLFLLLLIALLGFITSFDNNMMSSSVPISTLSKNLLADMTSEEKLATVNTALLDIPSYELDPTPLSGSTLKIIYLIYKELGIDLNTILPISQARLYRQFHKEDVDLAIKDSLITIARLVDKGLTTFGEWSRFQEWLYGRVENLAGRRPIDLVALQTGRYEVSQTLERIEYGLYG